MQKQGTEFLRQIPNNFFSVFTCSLREIYADLLFLVYQEYRKRTYTLSREYIIEIFMEYVESTEEQLRQLEEENWPPIE